MTIHGQQQQQRETLKLYFRVDVKGDLQERLYLQFIYWSSQKVYITQAHIQPISQWQIQCWKVFVHLRAFGEYMCWSDYPIDLLMLEPKQEKLVPFRWAFSACISVTYDSQPFCDSFHVEGCLYHSTADKRQEICQDQ